MAAMACGCGFVPDGGGDDGDSAGADLGPLVCRGERYDVDGRDDTGCEAEDLPLQDTPESALAFTLPDVVDKARDNPLNYAGYIFGDARTHDGEPAARPHGRPDWYRVTAEGIGDPQQKMGACLSVVSLPDDNQWEVCISEAGKTVFGTNQCLLVAGGGGSVCVRPASQPDVGGPFYVRVRKLAGSNTLSSYALYLSH